MLPAEATNWWGFIQKHWIYLLDFKSNAFWELLSSPKSFFVGQNYTLIWKGKKSLPTKAQLSALGTRGSNNSIKIRCTSDWNTTNAQAAVFFPAKLCVIWGGNKNIFYQPMIKPDVWVWFFLKSRLIFQGTLKQVCMKLLQQFFRNIIKDLIFCQIPYGGRFYSGCSTFSGFLSVPHVTNTCIYFCWLSCSDFEQDFLIVFYWSIINRIKLFWLNSEAFSTDFLPGNILSWCCLLPFQASI